MATVIPKRCKSRIHLLAAREAPTIVVVQRKRAKLFHLITIDTEALQITEGSWFRGRLYGMRCDVSFDGRFMVYLAMGANGKIWNGICRLPWLTTLIEAENTGAWYGGGYFADRELLKTNNWGTSYKRASESGSIPFRLEAYTSRHGGEDLGVLYERLQRDGFTRLGENWGKQRKLDTNTHQVEWSRASHWRICGRGRRRSLSM